GYSFGIKPEALRISAETMQRNALVVKQLQLGMRPATLSEQVGVDATNVTLRTAGEVAEKQREQVEKARKWLEHVETACGGSNTATAWAKDSLLFTPNIRDWADWANKALEKAGCPENPRKALLRDLDKELLPSASRPLFSQSSDVASDLFLPHQPWTL